jgi:predicted ATPase/class 3 adenylate cyclase
MMLMADRLPASGITRREAEVLARLGDHLSNAEIAAQLFVSERTVESHVSSLLHKVGARDRHDLVRRAAAGLSSGPGQAERGPSGTVTFLFTDIEDSTVLWERWPKVMPEALARHDEVVTAALSRHGGRVFSPAGDGFGAAFASASNGVAAAADVMCALAAVSWPGGIEVRVRIGLHTGTATERSGNYFGGAVNRAARVAAAGRGGQILLSAATADLVADDGWSMVDLGLHRLRGLDRPERVFRLEGPGLPVVQLPLRASRARGGNLPHASSAIIGRRAELIQLGDAIATHRLVTIMGPGGVGKTRLAIAAAEAETDRFSDGAWFVELGELDDAADVAPAVATTLALQPTSGTDRIASTVAAMADQRALVVLDNCEHILDGVIPFVIELESRCPGLTIVLTSREALGLAGEFRFAVHPLAFGGTETSAASELFCERAVGVLGRFQPADEELALIDDICRQLDGLPLAIELAAARLSAMGLSELRDNLSHGFELLTRRRSITTRQQSLRNTVAWSYDLLTAAEQSLFDRLSVFYADFAIAAADAVASASSTPADELVASLIDKSLLSTIHGACGTRFRQLETLREYGQARLVARGEIVATMQRLVRYYVMWAESADHGIKGSDEQHWHDGFSAEWPNVRTAFRWACESDDGDAACRLVSSTLWWATSRMRLEAEQWCHLGLELPSASDHPLRPILCAGASFFAHMRGDGAAEQRMLELAHAEEARLGPAEEPWVQAAVCNQWNGGPDAALRDAAALRRRADASDEWWRLTASLGEAFILATVMRGAPPPPIDQADHIDRIRHVVEGAESFGQPSSVASAYASLGTALRTSQPHEATTLLERALDVCEPLGVEDVSSNARQQLASHYTQLGRPLDALTLTQDALPRCIRAGAWHDVEPTLASIAQALADAGRPRVAATILGRLEALFGPFTRTYHRFDTLHDHLVDALGADDLDTLLNQSATLPIGDLAQLVIDNINTLVDQNEAGNVTIEP